MALKAAVVVTAVSVTNSCSGRTSVLGQRLADELLEKGAARLIAHERASHSPAEES